MFLRLRSRVNQLLSLSAPIVSQLKHDNRPFSKSILEKLKGKPFLKYDNFDLETGKLARSYIWTESQEQFPIQQFCIVSLKATSFIREGVVYVNSTHNSYLSCLKSFQNSEIPEKSCYGKASVPRPYEMYPFVLNSKQVHVIKILTAKLVFISCKNDSQSFANKGIMVILVSSSCLIQLDTKVIQYADPSVSSDISFKLLANTEFSYATPKESAHKQAADLDKLSDEIKRLLSIQDAKFLEIESDQNSDIDMLQLFDIGITSAFSIIALALIVLFWKLIKVKGQKNEESSLKQDIKKGREGSISGKLDV